MEQQLSLNLDHQPAHWDARPRRREGLAWFYAVMPEPADATQLRGLGASLLVGTRLQARLRPPELLHITLLEIPMNDGSVLQRLAVARQIGASITDPPFEIIFSKAMSFGAGRNRPLVLSCYDGAAAALTGLHDRLFDLAETSGLPMKGGSSFTPHLTLAYGRKAVADVVLDEPVRWRARELVFVCSLQGQSKYVIMGRWAFQPRPN